MNTDEFRRLIESYGTKPANWPEHVSAEAMQFLQTSEAARQIVTIHEPLDKALDRHEVNLDLTRLDQRILAQLPAQQTHLIDQVLAWILPKPNHPSSFWRPALVACLPLVFGIAIGSNLAIGTDTTSEYVDDELLLMALQTETDIITESLP